MSIQQFRWYVTCLIICIFSSVSFAEESDSFVSVKAGMLMEGEMYSDPPDQYFDTDSGFMLQVNLETMLAEKMSAGVFYQRANTASLDESVTISTYGVNLKAHVANKPNVKIRPGIAIGYQTMTGAGIEDDITGLDIGGFIELLFPNIAGQNVLAEVGFISQAAGGNKDADVTFAPIMYVLAGVSFDL